MDKNIRGLPQDLTNWPYGEMGLGVTLNPAAMTPAEVAKREAMYKNHAFEEYVSEMISLDRTLPDWRGQWCRDTYDLDSHNLKVSNFLSKDWPKDIIDLIW